MMVGQEQFTVRACRADEMDAFVENYGRLTGAAGADFEPDWRARLHDFIAEARLLRGFQAVAAVGVDGIVGTAAGHAYDSVGGRLRRPDVRATAYLWGVWVNPEHRRRGIARALVAELRQRFAAQGCSRIRLHATDMGRPLYRALGFEPTNEMQLTLDG